MEISVENFQEVKMGQPLEAVKYLFAYTHKPRHPTTFFSHVLSFYSQGIRNSSKLNVFQMMNE